MRSSVAASADGWKLRSSVAGRHSWTDGLKTQRRRSGGRIIKWAQRSKAGEGDGGLRSEPDGVLQTSETRLEDAAEAWGGLWRGGDKLPQASGEALEPITGEALRKVLKRQGGTGGWSPKERQACRSWADDRGLGDRG